MSPLFRADTGGDRPLVVLLHSLALDHTLWNEIVEDLRADCRTIAFDLPGHGASRQVLADSIEAMADRVADTLSSEATPPALAPAIVVGLSLGGCVAQALAIGHPDLVGGLVLADTTAWYGPDAPQTWAQRAEQAATAGLGSLAEFQLTRWFTEAYRQTHPDVCAQLLKDFAANDIDRYRDTCQAMGAMDLRARLDQIRVPTAILVGDQDPATPLPMAEELQQRIEGASLEVIPGCKHLSVIERPDAVIAAIRRHLSHGTTSLL
jgi:3-oxoadipate enol-lactonase